MREKWVDIAKGIAIISVVLGHIGFLYPKWQILPILTLLVWLWHVPVFFLIGGFFIKEEKLQNPFKFIKGKLKNLYLPILYIYVPILLLHNFFFKIGFYDTQTEYVGKYITEWSVSDFLKHLVESILFAGREPLLGAMWFVYVLFLALCGLSIISWALKKLVKDSVIYEYVRFLVLLACVLVSCTMTNVFDFTIPRFNNTITAIWLIYLGMMIVQKQKILFNNKYIVLISAFLTWHTATILGGGRSCC